MPRTTDAQWSLFSIVFQTFGLWQANWANKFWGIWGIFGWTISITLALWVVIFPTKKRWFSGLSYTYIPNTYTPNSHHTYVVGVLCYSSQKILHRLLKREEKAIFLSYISFSFPFLLDKLDYILSKAFHAITESHLDQQRVLDTKKVLFNSFLHSSIQNTIACMASPTIYFLACSDWTPDSWCS